MNITKILEKREKQDFARWERTHRAHLVVGRSYVITSTYAESLCLLKAKIIVLNDLRWLENTPTSWYHETLTQFRLKKLYARKEDTWKNSIHEIEEYLLLNEAKSESMFEHRDRETLFSVEARAIWIPPNLKELLCP